MLRALLAAGAAVTAFPAGTALGGDSPPGGGDGGGDGAAAEAPVGDAQTRDTQTRHAQTRDAPVGEADADFEETYRGRRIRGSVLRPPRGAGAQGGATRAAGDVERPQWQVTVDGRPLPLMRRADGSYLSMVDHYQSYPTAREAARAAVDELGPTIGPRAMTHTTGENGDGHDVHA